MAAPEFADEEIAEIEAALFSLSPGPSRIDRDHVMFAAGEQLGRRSAAGRGAVVSSLAGALVVVTLACIGTLVYALQRPTVIREVVYVDRPTQTERTLADSLAAVLDQNEAPNELNARGPVDDFAPLFETVRPAVRTLPDAGDMNYLQLREAVLRRGIDALPQSNPAARHARRRRTPTRAEMLDELLGVPAALSPSTGTDRL